MYYLEDTETRKQESLGTRDRAETMSLLNARNESVRQPQLNLQIAKAYLAGTDSGVATACPQFHSSSKLLSTEWSWRITSFKEVARAIANCSYRISDR
ncbi:MAG: hypothetical protein L0Z50_07110 [Verrucomicrobiales bacterium]|nr:hypothetical protein [Verrucomicrobiales bacterium]